MTDDLNTNAAKVGLRISCEKTKAMFVGEPPTTSISVGSNLLQSVDNFQYLGSYISNQSDIEVDIRARLGKAALVFQRLGSYGLVTLLTVSSKFRLYTSIVLSTALHACETCTEVNGEYPQHSGCVPPSMYPKDPGTVVARLCHQRGVD